MNKETQKTSFISIYHKNIYENRKILFKLHVKEKKTSLLAYIILIRTQKPLLFALSFIKRFEFDFF